MGDVTGIFGQPNGLSPYRASCAFIFTLTSLSVQHPLSP